MLKFFKRSKARKQEEKEEKKQQQPKNEAGKVVSSSSNAVVVNQTSLWPQSREQQQGGRAAENRTSETSSCSYDATAIDAARINSSSGKSSSNFLIDIMGKGRRGRNYHQQKKQQQQQQYSKQNPARAAGKQTNVVKNENEKSAKQRDDSESGTVTEGVKNSPTKINVAAVNDDCDVAVTTTHAIIEKIIADIVAVASEESDEPHTNEQAAVAPIAPPEPTSNATDLQENSNEPNTKSQIVLTAEIEEATSSLAVALASDEMGQPNSKNTNGHNQQTNYRSPSRSPCRIDSSSNGGRGSSTAKTVRFDDSNLVTTISYNADTSSSVDEIFYEASAPTTDPDPVPLVESENFDEDSDEDEDDLVSAISEDQITVDVVGQQQQQQIIQENYASCVAKNTETLIENHSEEEAEETEEKCVKNESEQNDDLECDCAFNDEFSDESEQETKTFEDQKELSNNSCADDIITNGVVSEENENLNNNKNTDTNSCSIYSGNSENVPITKENNNNNNNNSISTHSKEKLEIDETHTETNNNSKSNSFMEDSVSLPDLVESSHQNGIMIGDQPKIMTEDKCIGNDKENMRDLVNEDDAKYRAELEAAEKEALAAQLKIDELRCHIFKLDRDIANYSGLSYRLQAELESANKESDSVRQKLRQQADEIEKIKRIADDTTDEWRRKYQDLELLQTETEEKLKATQKLCTSLQVQIANVTSETEKCQLEKEKLMQEKMEEQKVLREALDKALKERTELEVKWKKDFEQIRNVNSEREERLMEDCEWKMRSMQKQCKEKLDTAEKEKTAAVEKMTEIQTEWSKHSAEISHIKAYEAELKQLRGLTNDQHESIQNLRQQAETLKADLATATQKLQDEIDNCQEIKGKHEWELKERERQAVNRIDIARGTIAMQWEDRLLEEMGRLKMELEQIGLEEKQSALNKMKAEYEEEIAELRAKFNEKQEELGQEITSLKEMVAKKQKEFDELQAKTDNQVVEARMFVQRAERENQAVLDREISKREGIIDSLKQEYAKEKQQMEASFRTRLENVQEEFARELTDTTEILKSTHKRELEEQWKQLISEKEEALQTMESRHRKKIDDAESQIRELIANHDRTLKDLQDVHTMERSSLEKRDSKNVVEIDTLHKKCRCLTKLFEEMRMRYERRDPRPEDLRQITELKNIVDAQDRDLRILTERLREMQMFQQHHVAQMQASLPPYQGMPPQYQPGMPPPRNSKSRTPQKPNGKPQNGNHNLPPPPPAFLSPEQIAMQKHLACEVIYEENESENNNNNGENGKQHTNGHHEHFEPKSLVGDIINEVVGSVNVQAHGLAESAF